MRITRRVLTASLLAMALAAPAFAADKPLILISVPGMNFPFFVHMMKAFKAEADQAGTRVRSRATARCPRPSRPPTSRPRSPRASRASCCRRNEVDAMAPALQEAIDANVPVVTVDRRVPSVTGIIGHVGADNVKGGEAQGNLIEKMFPNGATIINLQGTPGASPAIDRNKGLHNVLDKAKDKYKIVFEQTANFDRDKGLSVTEGALAGMATPPQVIVAAQRRHGARGARSGQGAQSQGHRHHRLRRAAGNPGQDPRRRDHRDDRAVPRQAERNRAWRSWPITSRPARNRRSRSMLITPVAITKDNLKEAERLDEVK